MAFTVQQLTTGKWRITGRSKELGIREHIFETEKKARDAVKVLESDDSATVQERKLAKLKPVGEQPKSQRLELGPVEAMSHAFSKSGYVRVIEIGGQRMQVPVNKKGEITKDMAFARLLSGKGTRKKNSSRSPLVDIGIKADGVAKDMGSEDAFRWWAYPNETDANKIDTPDSELMELLNNSRDIGVTQMAVIGSEKDREQILGHINRNFTLREKRKLKGVVVEVGPAGRGVAGYYTQRAGLSMGHGLRDVAQYYIRIDPKYTNSPTVIVHEVIHHLRNVEEDRKGVLKHKKHWESRDTDLDEALTDAETLARQNPYTVANDTGAGYHSQARSVRKSEKTAASARTDDRRLFTNRPKSATLERIEFSGTKGKRAHARVLKNFPDSHISTVKLHGKAEAIDTYLEMTSKQGATSKVHVFSPGADVKGVSAFVDEISKDLSGGKVQAWVDGKLSSTDELKRDMTPKKELSGTRATGRELQPLSSRRTLRPSRSKR